jgi:radical SAM protein with 4Fe4S-binding SPASM domain
MAGERPRVHGIAVELTARCNQRCAYCYNPQGERGESPEAAASRDESSPSEALPLVRRVRRLLDAWDVDHVTLTGGEPLAEPQLWALLTLLRERAVPTQLISNGGLVTPELAERLARDGVRSVQVTLNGATARLHGAHTGSEQHFEAARRGVRELRSAGVRVVGCVVLTHLNAIELSSILELWCALGVRTVALSRFSPAGRAVAHASRLLPTLAELEQAFAQAVPFARDRGLRVSSTMPVPPCMLEPSAFAPLVFGHCAVGTSLQELALGADGRLRHCTLHRGALAGSGDVLDPTLDLAALLRHDDVVGYPTRSPEFCVGCLHERTCGGGCGAAGDWLSGVPASGRARAARRALDPLVAQHVDDETARALGRLDGAGS